jgi:4a-hydroxytetrahydrobiopterin dehydratase
VGEWRVTANVASATFLTGSFARGLEFVDVVGSLADAVNHHPDVDLRYSLVTIRLTTHDIHALSERDVVLARRISEAARELGLSLVEQKEWGVLMERGRDIADEQIAACNRRDIDGFVNCYAEGARVVQPDGSLLASGRDEIRARYGELFEQSPHLRAEIGNRIDVGAAVIDEERVTGFVLPGMPPEIHAAIVYRVEDGLIQDAHLYG